MIELSWSVNISNTNNLQAVDSEEYFVTFIFSPFEEEGD